MPIHFTAKNISKKKKHYEYRKSHDENIKPIEKLYFSVEI